MSEEVEITNVPLEDVVAAVYELSRPQGMGFLHYEPGPMSEELKTQVLDYANSSIEDRGDFYLDYVSGRACKFRAKMQDGKMYMSSNWFDHSPEEFQQLRERLGV